MNILKTITVAFAIVAANTEFTSGQTLSIGPMAGVNISTITAAPNTKYLGGISLGGFANYSINENFGLSAKLLYSQLGSAYTFNGDINRLHYIQVPISGVYYFGNGGDKFRPKVYAGLYAGSLLRANHKSGDEVLLDNGQPKYKKGDVGGQIGLGFNYLIKSRTWLNVDAGYAKGFSNLTENPIDQYRNAAFSLNVGVSFPVSSK